jgi:hypothetical protein
MKPLRILLLYGASAANATFSYQQAWPHAFQGHSRFQCTRINLLDRRWRARVAAAAIAATWRGDAVVLLHSVFSNACLLSGRLFDLIARMPQPKAYFIGNEYKLMPQKMEFCERLPLQLLVSQTRSPRVHQLYRERLRCAVVGIPNTGLDPLLFRPETPSAERSIDLGYRAEDPDLYIGHTERRDIAEYFRSNADRLRLRVDVSLDRRCRLAGRDWARFLDRCKGQLGTEAGGDFFELTDETRLNVNQYAASHPDAGFPEIWDRFFRNYRDPVPIRIMSGRNVEAAGTRTVQLLFEGAYDGYFQPDEHYIPLKKDFSNVDEALGKFRDEAYCRRVSTNAYELAMTEFRYDRLIDVFADTLASSI